MTGFTYARYLAELDTYLRQHFQVGAADVTDGAGCRTAIAAGLTVEAYGERLGVEHGLIPPELRYLYAIVYRGEVVDAFETAAEAAAMAQEYSLAFHHPVDVEKRLRRREGE